MKKFKAVEIEDVLQEAIYELDESGHFSEGEIENISTETFSEAGLLTLNKGIVLTINGEEFQITIVKRGE